MVEIVNDRPAFKVCICYSQEKLATKGQLLLNFSETKRLKVAKKYISGMTTSLVGQERSGVCHQVQISKPEMINAICTSNRSSKVSKNS